MGKQGPCYHCGVTSTPLWRNGPPDKPVLCNACGSRWRIKGTLANYRPLHARPDADEYDDQRVSKPKTIKLGNEKLKKRKLSSENFVSKKLTDEDISNRSSSGSASFVQFNNADTSEFTGFIKEEDYGLWDTQVPSKKRTCVTHTKSSSVDKLIKDLHAILHDQQSSYLCGSPEEDLLFESDAPMVSVEIGHGSVLIKHPSSFIREEDSEASSVSFGNKLCTINEAYCGSTSLSGSNCFKRSVNHTREIEVESGSKFKRPLQEQNPNIPGKGKIEGLKRGPNKSGVGSNEPMDKDSSFSTPRSLFHSRLRESCNDEDLLIDAPSNGYFPEAEFLIPSSSITSSSNSIHQAMILH